MRARVFFELGSSVKWSSDEDARELAIDYFSRAISLRSDYSEAYYEIAMIHYRDRNFYSCSERVFDNLNQAIEINSNYVEALFARGACYQQGQELTSNTNREASNLLIYESAIRDYMFSVDVSSDAYKSYNNLGLIYYRTGNYSQAIEYFSKSIAVVDIFVTSENYSNYLNLNEVTVPYINRALVYVSISDYEKAITDYTQALNILERLVRMMESVGGHSRGYSGEIARLYFDRAILSARLGNQQQAISDLKEAAHYYPLASWRRSCSSGGESLDYPSGFVGQIENLTEELENSSLNSRSSELLNNAVLIGFQNYNPLGWLVSGRLYSSLFVGDLCNPIKEPVPNNIPPF